jgi:hypothetical protein
LDETHRIVELKSLFNRKRFKKLKIPHPRLFSRHFRPSNYSHNSSIRGNHMKNDRIFQNQEKVIHGYVLCAVQEVSKTFIKEYPKRQLFCPGNEVVLCCKIVAPGLAFRLGIHENIPPPTCNTSSLASCIPLNSKTRSLSNNPSRPATSLSIKTRDMRFRIPRTRKTSNPCLSPFLHNLLSPNRPFNISPPPPLPPYSPY